MKKVCFTGHRKIQNPTALNQKLHILLESLIIEDNSIDFYAGGALGFDMICESEVIELRKKYPQIKLHLILPCSNAEQTKKWTDEQKNKFDEILALADTVEYVSEYYTKNCMKKRNARLVELADFCICYYSGRVRSGTGQTVKMALNEKMEIYNLFDIAGSI